MVPTAAEAPTNILIDICVFGRARRPMQLGYFAR